MLAQLEPKIAAKVGELAETVALKRAGKADEALAIVLADRGKNNMDTIREILRDETEHVERKFVESIETQRSNANALRWTIVGGGHSYLARWQRSGLGFDDAIRASCWRRVRRSRP